MKNFINLILSVLIINNLNAQDFSNKGKEFWIPYSYHQQMIGGSSGGVAMTLYITSDQNTPYTVETFGSPSTTIQTGNISAGQVISVSIPNTNFINDDGIFNNKTVRVTGDKDLVVYSFITFSAVSAATLCLPSNVLGKEYYAMSFTQRSNSPSFGYITIIATEDLTTVEITPTVATKAGWAANSVNTINLNKGQIYQVLAASNSTDITGTKVKSVSVGAASCKKIAVFSGSGRLVIGSGGCGSSSDNLYQQLYPTNTWGRKFISIPSYNRPSNFYRVTKLNSSTIVKLNGTVITPAAFVNGFYYEFQNSIPNVIEGDGEIGVAQYFTSQNCDGNGNPFDPEMIILSPLEQNINKVTLVNAALVANGAHQHHLHVVIPNTGTSLSSFRLDGNPVITPWLPVPGEPNYSYNYMNNVAQGFHTLYSDTGFNALAYGYGNAETYGYSAGASVKDLYQFATVSNQNADTSISFAAGCKNSPFSLFQRLPYKPLSITWDFTTSGLPFANSVNSNPSTILNDSINIGGKWVFRYKNPNTYTVNTPGTYPIKVIVNNPTGDGCSGIQEIDYDLQIFDPPVANFSFLNNGCTSDTVRFNENSTVTGSRPVYKWRWLYDDNSVDSIKSPKKLFTSGGDHPVKLQIITDVGCLSDTITKIVSLSIPPTDSFSISPNNCAKNIITFTDLSLSNSTQTTITNWVWIWGDNTPNETGPGPKTHIYQNAGNYIAKLVLKTNTGCESDSFFLPINIKPIPFTSFEFGITSCLPLAVVQFLNQTTVLPPSTSISYIWDFGDPSSGINNSSNAINPIHNYAATGNYPVKLTATSNDGCIKDTTINYSGVLAQPTAQITAPFQACLNNSVTITKNDNPINGTISQWNFLFGDNPTPLTFTTDQVVTHTYTTPGTYTIKHWFTSSNNCLSDTGFATIKVSILPVASFTTTGPFCEKGTVRITNSSTTIDGTITKWYWDYGDGITTVLLNGNPIDHLYAVAGPYVIKLKVETNEGCISPEISVPVTVNSLPFTSFTTNQACLPFQSSQFNNNSTIAGAGTLTFAWDFGDPASGILNNSNLISPSHLYNNIGPFNVKLTATSNNACVKDTNISISNIYAQPKAIITAPLFENCLNNITNLTQTSTGSGYPIQSYHWNLGNTTTSTNANPSLTYANPIVYNVTHWVVNDKGCFSDTVNTIVKIDSLPTASFTLSNPVCETKPITLSSTSIPNTGNIVTWTWNLGAGPINNTNGNPFTQTYPSWGTQPITLQVITDKGCKSSITTKNVFVNAQPFSGFISPEVCLNDIFAPFLDTSKIANGSIVSWAWNFGDIGSGINNISNLQNPQHSYTAVGNYTATLTVTSDSGCITTKPQTFTVNGSIPIANRALVNIGNICSLDSVAIRNTSTVNFGNQTKVEIIWDNINAPLIKQTDDLPTLNQVYKHLYPDFQFPASKIYQVKMITYSGITCLSDTTIFVIVNATPKVVLANFPDQCLTNSNITLTQGSITTILPGTGVYSGVGVTNPTGQFNPSIAGTGTHIIRYTYTTTAGCSDFVEKPIKVLLAAKAFFVPQAILCEKNNITFTQSSTSLAGTITNWDWNFGDGSPIVNNTNGNPVIHPFALSGPYTVRLTITTDAGCVTSFDSLIVITPSPKPNFSFNDTLCMPNPIAQFTNLSTVSNGSALTYVWDFDDPTSTSNSSTAINPSHTYSAPTSYSVKLIVTSNPDGCIRDTTIVLNTIHDAPIADFNWNLSDSVCTGGAALFTDASIASGGSLIDWKWNYGDNTPVLTGQVQNAHTFAAAQTYPINLAVKNNWNCIANKTKNYKVYPYPTNAPMVQINVLEGGTAILMPIVTGNIYKYLWSPVTGLNNIQIQNPTTSPITDITYKLTVTAEGGCSTDASVFVKVLLAPIIPNTFTPNEDGINDLWNIDYLSSYPNCRMQVFDRYGVVVFESKGYTKPWNGTYKGKTLPIGTYYYVLEPGNARKPITGYVTLIK